jgi:hypothetical protein
LYWVFHAIPREPYLFQLKENNMSSTHKISALRSLATKVALGLGIALVASSIAPMAVAPASATSPDVGIWYTSQSQQGVSLRGVALNATTAATPLPLTIPSGSMLWDTALWGNKLIYITGPMGPGSTVVNKVNLDGTGAGTLNISHSPAFTQIVMPTISGDTMYFMGQTSQGSPSNLYSVDLTNPQLPATLVWDNMGNNSLVLNTWAIIDGHVYAVMQVRGMANGNTTPVAYDIYEITGPTTATSVQVTGMTGSETCTANPPCSKTGYASGWFDALVKVGNTWLVEYTASQYDYVLKAIDSSGLQALSIGISGSIPNGMQVEGGRLFIGFVPSTNNNVSASARGLAEFTYSNGTLTEVARASGFYPFGASVSLTQVPQPPQQQQQQQQNNAPAQPAPELDLSGLKTIPAPTAGVTGGLAGIDLKGKNLPVVSSVTVSGKDGKVVTSTDSALKLDLPTLAPGSYDIVMKTAGGGSITIQNGLVIAPPLDNTPVKPVVITPSVPRTTLVAATAPVPGFIPGKATVSDAQKAIIQDVVLTKNVTALECVGVSNAKVSAKLAAARAAAICAAAKQQNPALTTSVRTTTEAKVNGPVGSVLINYSH